MALPGGFQTVQLTPSDRIALTAAFDQLFGVAAGLPEREAALRAQLLELTPGRAAVGALVTFGGILSFLYREDLGHADVFRQIVQSALEATHYQELRL